MKVRSNMVDVVLGQAQRKMTFGFGLGAYVRGMVGQRGRRVVE